MPKLGKRAGRFGKAQLAVPIFAAVLFFWQLGGHDVWAPDEPYFAEGAREMVVDGEWVVPHVNGKVTTDKPPLFFWLIALFSLPLGEVTPVTARLPSVLAALGTVFLTMRLGRRFYDPRTAALAGVILSTAFMFWDKARWSQIDSLLCFLIWTALTAFEAWRAGDADGRRAGLLFWLAAALAVLAKGPVGFLLPLGIALVVLAWDRRLGSWREFAPVLGPALFAGVLSAWVIMTEVAGPAEYSVWGALREHFIDRGIHGMHHEQPFWYFLERLPQSLLPWTGLVPGALVLAWRRRSAADRLVFGAALFVFFFFSISTEKRELYALPSLPAFALMAAALAAAVAGWSESRSGDRRVSSRWLYLGHGVIAALIALVGLVSPFAAERFDEVTPVLVLPLAAVLFATGCTTLFFCWRARFTGALLAPAIGVGLLYLLAVTTVYPEMEPRKSARPFTLLAQDVTKESLSAGIQVVSFRLGNLPEHFAFHGNGFYTEEIFDPADLARHLERPVEAFAIVNGDDLEGLPAELESRLVVVASTRLARRDVFLVANYDHPSGRPLAEVLEKVP